MINITRIFKTKSRLLLPIGIGIILLLGFLVRIAPLWSNQIYFWFDQGLDAVLTYQLVVDHRLSLVSRYSGLQGVLMGPLWTWVLAVPFVIGGGHPAANVVFFSLISLISTVFTAIFLSRFASKAAALIAIVFLSFAPVYVYNSQVIASPHPLTFLFVFFLWFCLELFVKKRPIFFIPLSVLIGIFFQLEVGFAIFTLPVALLLLIAFKGWSLLSTRYFLIGILILGLSFVPQLLFDLRHDFLISRSLLAFFTGDSNNLYSHSSSLPIRFIERLKTFYEDLTSMALFIRPWYLSLTLGLLSLFGWLVVIKKGLHRELILLKALVIILSGFYICFSFYPGPLWTWYRSGLPIIYILLVIIPLAVLWTKVRPLGLAVLLLLIISFHQSLNSAGLPRILARESFPDNAILENQLAALDYVYDRANGRPFAYYAYTPPVYDYVWQYNFWWYGKNHLGALPTNWSIGVPLLGTGRDAIPPVENQGLFFVILEPDHERPWQPTGWLKTVIKVGRVVDRREFPGGIIVEERTTL